MPCRAPFYSILIPSIYKYPTNSGNFHKHLYAAITQVTRTTHSSDSQINLASICQLSLTHSGVYLYQIGINARSIIKWSLEYALMLSTNFGSKNSIFRIQDPRSALTYTNLHEQDSIILRTANGKQEAWEYLAKLLGFGKPTCFQVSLATQYSSSNTCLLYWIWCVICLSKGHKHIYNSKFLLNASTVYTVMPYPIHLTLCSDVSMHSSWCAYMPHQSQEYALASMHRS